ncbi:hypothetical protein PG984_008337 [Apiospora sp. TS-2023a]
MYSSVKLVSLLSLVVLGLASPAPDSLRLDNGQETVNVALGSRDRGAALEARGNLDCKGSAFCERLGGSCDDAFRQIKPGNTYLTGGNKGSSGTCSGTCGVFVSGDHCSVLGSQLQSSYEAIRNHGCSHCGRETLDNGCLVKIDRVTGC